MPWLAEVVAFGRRDRFVRGAGVSVARSASGVMSSASGNGSAWMGASDGRSDTVTASATGRALCQRKKTQKATAIGP